MFSLNYKHSSWLKNYILYRIKIPFSLNEKYFRLFDENSTYDNFDNYLYSVTKDNGIFFGCPIISTSILKSAKALNFPQKKGGTIMLFLDTLFSIALIEQRKLSGGKINTDVNNFEADFLQIIFLVIEYFIPSSFYRIPRDLNLKELLKDNGAMNRALEKLEIYFLDTITLKNESNLGNRQNIFAFLKLYFFLNWTRENKKNYNCSPSFFHKIDEKIREEMISQFGQLVWANSILDSTEILVIKRYIEQTSLPKKKQTELYNQIIIPVKKDINLKSFKSLILRNFIIEQLILLSLINNQRSWQEKKLIKDISHSLGISEKRIELLFCIIAEFFSKNYKKLEYLKKKSDILKFYGFVNNMVISLVKKNLDKIMKEINETKELSRLLIKSTTIKLTEKEKNKVKDQLLDIAKSIPAIAIFAVPGGSLLLPVMIKVLPFNILPSSFIENSDHFEAIENE